MLFRYLNDDAFLAFSREHKHLYSLILLDLYERFFSGAPAYPTPQEVTHTIYDVMRANPSLWSENDDFGEQLPEIVSAGRRRIKRSAKIKTETADRALLIARQLYQRLITWGWLEEEEYGLRVTVDMSMGPLLVIQRLASLNKDVSQRFGGLIVTVRVNLEAVEKLNPQVVDRKQREVALALREARNQVDQFTKSLRAILSDLKRIRRTVMESKTVGDRLEAFFEEFVEQLLLRDFEAILTFNHPYRFRDTIVDLARKIAHTPSTMQVLSEEYVSNSISPSMSEAILDVEGDLLAIESTFGHIGEMFERIEVFRRQLEARVRNTIKYAERGTHGLVGRAGDLVRRLDGLIARGRHPNATIEWSLEQLRSPWSEFHHAPSREPRKPIELRPLGDWPSDPLYEIRKKLRSLYIDRISPGPEDVRRFLETQVPAAGTREARFMTLRTVDDFLAFDAARRYALTNEIPPELGVHFELELASDLPPHDSEWLRCANFIVRRHAATRRRHAQ
ncbi:Wadjet anti-phage system protein JetA family protein [Bradyrhizobium centrolobii]|uniref:Wadjet anti-phage system protein JetA family protein n=1 Tax=Bradyrhizobium centrolobii TaxID=1505087 RepID=UPI000A74C9A5|nr:Wadjet anti-phage system protein JetA family protein [Bradyrhizobium centrolobii]